MTDTETDSSCQRLPVSRRLGSLFTALGTAGYYLAYGYIVWRTFGAA
jgi:hypothetical protein